MKSRKRLREIEASSEILDQVDELCGERGRAAADRYLRRQELIKPGERLYDISYRIGPDGQPLGRPTMMRVTRGGV
jgi:hypothetical protein